MKNIFIFTGFFINEFFQGQIKKFFTVLLFLVLIFIALVLIARFSLRKIVKFLAAVGVKLWQAAVAFTNLQLEKYEKYKRVKRIQEKYNVTAAPDAENGSGGLFSVPKLWGKNKDNAGVEPEPVRQETSPMAPRPKTKQKRVSSL